MGPVTRGSRPMIVSPYSSPTALPTWRARSGVMSRFPRPRIPDDPKRGTPHGIPRTVESLPWATARADNDYIQNSRCFRALSVLVSAAEGLHGHGTREHRSRDREGEEK